MGNPISSSLLEILAAATAADAPCLVIGGNAVIMLGVPRFTRDIDLAIPEDARHKWDELLVRLGYRFFHGTGDFRQFAADGKPDLDLMLVDTKTWIKLMAESATHAVSADIDARVPAPLHLVGMKLHALRDPTRRHDNHDWDDAVALCRQHQIDPSTGIAREFVMRYAGEQLAAKLIQTLND